MTAYFENLPAVLGQHLAVAQQRLQIAVCWFSHRDLFAVLLDRLRAGVAVELILEFDTQNIRENGLDFQQFIRLGGQLYAYRDTALMHHKFALMDDRLLLTGSFNWTYSSNAENVLATGDPAVVAAFQTEFNRLKALSVQVRKIRASEVKAFNHFPLFNNAHFQLNDLRRRISGGAKVWWINAGRQPDAWLAHFRAHRLPFDPAGLLRPYWTAFRIWDEALLESVERPPGVSPASLRSIRLLARRMQAADLVLAVSGRQQVIALGIIQSEPKPWPDGAFSSYREVQWLKVTPDAPYQLPRPVSPGQAGRFRGSALQVVQAVLG